MGTKTGRSYCNGSPPDIITAIRRHWGWLSALGVSCSSWTCSSSPASTTRGTETGVGRIVAEMCVIRARIRPRRRRRFQCRSDRRRRAVQRVNRRWLTGRSGTMRCRQRIRWCRRVPRCRWTQWGWWGRTRALWGGRSRRRRFGRRVIRPAVGRSRNECKSKRYLYSSRRLGAVGMWGALKNLINLIWRPIGRRTNSAI